MSKYIRTITIDSRDLSYTIDTYGMFTGDSTDESEAEYYTEEYNLTEDEQYLIDFDYDHDGIVEYLANESVDLLHQNIVQHGNGIVLDINLNSQKSPQFYNYTTDSYTADWTVNTRKLESYCKQHKDELLKFLEDNWYTLDCANEDDLLTAKIDFYTSKVYDREEYESRMYECENVAYSENMRPSKDFQKILDEASRRVSK